MAIHDIATGATDESNASSRLDTKEIDLQAEGQSSIEIMNNTRLINDTKNSQNKEITESIENDQRSDEENSSRQRSEKITKKKYRHFLNSDSEEEEEDVISLLLKKETKASSESLNKNNTETSEAISVKSKSYRRLIDSDSEVEDNADLTKNINDDDDSRNTEEKSSGTQNARTKALMLDSDSEDNIVDKAKNSNINDEDSDSRDVVKKKINALVDSESEDNDASKNVTPSSPVEKRKKITSHRKKNQNAEKTAKKFSSLIDTDSESDKDANEIQESPTENSNKNGHSVKKNEKSEKKRTGSQRASREEAMRQIHSETQRLIRTSEVSLPYHRPKQRSLQDFLNRKIFIPSLPQGLTTAAKVKMSSELVGKVLEEKEKEAELFYKSSDSEDETVNCTPAYSKETRETSNAESSIDQIGIEETQKLLKNDVQHAHNKKEIIKQGGVDLGVPRKLFASGTTEFIENDVRDEEDMEDEENFHSEDPKKNLKETKHGLREVSVPRKLFSFDYDEGVGSPLQNSDVSTLASKTTISESSQQIEGQTDSVDTGMDSLSQENESSISEGAFSKNYCNTEETEINESVKENFETSNISETPFISNKEIGRAKEKDKALRQTIDSDENCKDDQIDPRNVFGNVIGLPLPEDMDDEIPKKNEKCNIKSKVLSTVSSVCPKLRGAPGMLIDLSDDVKPNKEGVQSLLDRFYRHSVVKKTSEVNSPVTVLHTEKTADGVRVVEQVLPYKFPKADSFNDKELSKPGAKHLKLKSELIEKMAKKRGEEWKLKEQREKKEEEERENEEFEEEFDEEDDAKIAEDEIELSGESEPEENDMPERKKKKKDKTSEFVDEEAEVSGEENDDVMEIDDEDEDEDDKEENTNQDDDENSDDSSDSDAEVKTVEKCKKLNRIVKAFEDDSNSLPESVSQSENNCSTKTFQRTKTDIDMFETDDGNGGWLSDAESELPPSQVLPRDQADARSQLCKTPLTAVNVLRFVSPITQLTALNSAMDSPKDFSATKSNSVSSQCIGMLSTEKTPIDKKSPESGEKRNGFQKKLFQEPSGTVNDEELMDLCSGSFTGIGNENRDAQAFTSNNKLSGNSQASQLLRFSSDSFFSQATDSQNDKNAKLEVDETSQDIRLTLDDDSQDMHNGEDTEKKSPVSRNKFKVASSSDDEDENLVDAKKKKKVLKKKKVKQLQLSDDEEEEELSNEDEEENEMLGDNDTEDKYVDYDSEENEVVIVPKKDIKKVAANFLDAEAELSESEWGSADEDEKDLDKLEMEEGDEEEIDENKMKDQLGKIHMRQILDDDKRDVRMLQELLFDDGDLHTDGSGRERKFKWKNIDKLGEDGNVIQSTNDGDENADQLEEENDLEWRKLRLEREKFIQEKMNTPTDEIDGEQVEGSTIFKVGIKALNKRKSSQTVEKETEEPITKKPIIPPTVMDLCGSTASDRNSKILHKAVKRGSFLARGDESLAHLAVRIKNTETTIVTRQKPGNFVFAHISPSVAGTTGKPEKDLTESEAASSANAKARKRKPPAGTTPRTVKKAKVDVSHSTGKKLF